MILFYVTYFPICYCHLQVTQNGITDWIAITVLWRKEETPLVKSICQTCCQFCLLLHKFIEQLQKKEINVKLLVNFDLWKKRKKTDTKVTFHLVDGHLVSYERDGKNKTFLLWCFCTYSLSWWKSAKNVSAIFSSNWWKICIFLDIFEKLVKSSVSFW